MGLIPQPNRKFSQAKSWEQMAQMLDDYFLLLKQQVSLQYPNAFAPEVAKSLNGVRVGSLINVNANGTVKWADRAYLDPDTGLTYSIDANGVVVDVLPNNNIVWSTFAKVNCSIFEGVGLGVRPVYLGQYGRPQASQPASGYIQTVGNIINFDARTQLYSVQFSLPGFSYTA